MTTIQTKLITSKWAMEKRSLYSFYNIVSNLQNIRTGGVRGFIMGNPVPLVKNELVLPDNVQLNNKNEGDIALVYVSGILTKGPSQEEQDILGLCNIDDICDSINEEAEDPSVNLICLDFNSPGGSTTGIEELGRLIKKVDTTIKPVVSFTSTTMCSAAYWLSSQTRYIGMCPSAQCLACGVYMLVLNAEEKYKMEGLEIQPIFSGERKLLGHDFKPLTKEEKELLQMDVNDQHQAFIDIIKSRRPNIDPSALTGLSYEGSDALELGAVDVLCDSLEEFLVKVNE